MRSSRILALEQKYIVKEDQVEEGPEETVSLFFSANEPSLEEMANSVSVAMEQYQHYSHVKKLVLESSEVSSHTFSFLKREMLKSNNDLGFEDTVWIAKEDYYQSSSKSLALEGISSFLKKIWDSIVNGFKWIVNKIKNFFGFGEKNTNHIRDLEKKLALVNKEIDAIVKGFPDIDSNELQQYHPLLISDACRIDKPELYNAYKTLQKYKKYVNLHYPSLSIENAFEQSAKELQLVIGNLLSIIGNKSPTSVFLKALSGRGQQLDEELKTKNIKEFPEYLDYVRNLKTEKDTMGGQQGILSYDKNSRTFANFNLPPEGTGKIVYFLPMLLSIAPWFLTLNKAETKEDSVFKDNVLVFKNSSIDTSSINDNDIDKEIINIITPNALLSMSRQFSAIYTKCTNEGMGSLAKEVPDLEGLVRNLERFNLDTVQTDIIEVLDLIMKVVFSYRPVGESLKAYGNNLFRCYSDYCTVTDAIYKNIIRSTKKEDILT